MAVRFNPKLGLWEYFSLDQSRELHFFLICEGQTNGGMFSYPF